MSLQVGNINLSTSDTVLRDCPLYFVVHFAEAMQGRRAPFKYFSAPHFSNLTLYIFVLQLG